MAQYSHSSQEVSSRFMEFPFDNEPDESCRHDLKQSSCGISKIWIRPVAVVLTIGQGGAA